jgi:prepilin-type N-terminal cleavage/methylation domain-containing protein
MKRKKCLKGMTLIECVVALAVFGIMSTLLITAVVSVYSSQKSTKHIVKETVYEAPIAVAKAKGATDAVKLTNSDNGTLGDTTDDVYVMKIAGVNVQVEAYRALEADGTGEGYTYFE